MTSIIIYLAIMFVLGIVICFKGEKVYFPFAMISVFLAMNFLFLTYYEMSWKGLAIGSILGIVLALLIRFIYKVGVFFAGIICGIILTQLLMQFLPVSLANYEIYIMIIMSIILGILAVKWAKVFIRLGTAIEGSSLIISTIFFLVYQGQNLSKFVNADGLIATITDVQQFIDTSLVNQNPIMMVGSFIGLSIVGFLYQMSNAS